MTGHAESSLVGFRSGFGPERGKSGKSGGLKILGRGPFFLGKEFFVDTDFEPASRERGPAVQVVHLVVQKGRQRKPGSLPPGQVSPKISVHKPDQGRQHDQAFPRDYTQHDRGNVPEPKAGEESAKPFAETHPEVVHHSRFREHQAGPGQGAAKDFRVDQIDEPPFLEVGALQVGKQRHPSSRLAQAVTQLDVFEAEKRRVESAHPGKGLPADRSAPGPEKESVPPRVLEIVMVNQVLV